MKTIKVATDFSRTPGARYPHEAKYSGAEFRLDHVMPALQEAIRTDSFVLIDLDGGAGYGCSFLDEAFGALVYRYGYTPETIFSYITFKSDEEPYLIDEIRGYVEDGENKAYLNSGQVLRNVHSKKACAGRHCAIHNPSDHHMKDWIQNWRDDRKFMERLCEHGIGHPDPDQMSYLELVLGKDKARYHGIHGCDGCCSKKG